MHFLRFITFYLIQIHIEKESQNAILKDFYGDLTLKIIV